VCLLGLILCFKSQPAKVLILSKACGAAFIDGTLFLQAIRHNMVVFVVPPSNDDLDLLAEFCHNRPDDQLPRTALGLCQRFVPKGVPSAYVLTRRIHIL
jgi:hypothetical protein